MADKCLICLEQFTNEREVCQLECAHDFHTKCILRWFREPETHGKCPLCRRLIDNEEDQEYRYRPPRTEEHMRVLQQIYKKREAPRDLIHNMTQYNKAEAKFKQRRKEYQEWKRTEEGKLYTRLRKINFKYLHNTGKARLRMFAWKRMLFEYPIPVIIKEPILVPASRRSARLLRNGE